MYWTVMFDGEDPGPSDDFVFKFRSLESLNIETRDYALDEKYVEALIKHTEIYDHYSIFGNIKKIVSPDGKEYSGKAFYALVGFYKSKDGGEDLGVGVLIAKLLAGDFDVLGIWPDDVAEMSQGDPEKIDRLFRNFLDYPDEWSDVMIIRTTPKDLPPTHDKRMMTKL